VNGVRGGEYTVASLADGMWEASLGAAGKTPVFHPLRLHSSLHSVVCVNGAVGKCNYAEQDCHYACQLPVG